MDERRALFATAMALSLTAAAAQEQEEVGRLNLQTVVEKTQVTVDAQGRQSTVLAPVETAVPGDELVYTVIFTNISDENAENVRVTNPIPAEMSYVENSAFGPGTDISYSIDDGASFSAPDALLVRLENGDERRATAADYTHIRWTLKSPLDAGARGFARFRAVVR